jgi:hypothetical protein
MYRETEGSVKSLVRSPAQDPPQRTGAGELVELLASSKTSSHGMDWVEDRLDSWKAIASYVGRSVRTAQRWEKEEHLPVWRHPHLEGSSVYGLKTEIDEWRKSRSLAASWSAESESALHRADTPGQLGLVILSLAADPRPGRSIAFVQGRTVGGIDSILLPCDFILFGRSVPPRRVTVAKLSHFKWNVADGPASSTRVISKGALSRKAEKCSI